ncbi:7951_t:CDS:2, partial [Funneliformis caledonium]
AGWLWSKSPCWCVRLRGGYGVSLLGVSGLVFSCGVVMGHSEKALVVGMSRVRVRVKFMLGLIMGHSEKALLVDKSRVRVRLGFWW